MSTIESVHSKCGKKLRGSKVEHCTECCETFGSTRAGDAHRKGEHPNRRCVDPSTLGQHQDEGGVWRLPGNPAEGLRPTTSEAGEQPEVA